MTRVSIQPDVGILSVLRHLNYTWWHALAEFVDNAVDSYLRERELLFDLWDPMLAPAPLHVRIDFDNVTNEIVITDNAGGIHEHELERALKPASPPPSNARLSEFGMGMKSAACWCSGDWSIVTSPLGEPWCFTVHLDVDQIIAAGVSEVAVRRDAAPAEQHFTRLTLRSVNNQPRTRTLSKVREHLADMYRQFLRDDELCLDVGDERIEFDEPKVLVAPSYIEGDELEGEQEWRKDIDIKFEDGRRVRGWAGLRATGSQSHAGLSLFRRGRVVMGTADEKWRPSEIFGARNSFRSQRLFGELHLEGFDVPHTKDGILWDGLESKFKTQLRAALDEAPLSLLKQANSYRAGQPKRQIEEAAVEAADRTVSSLKANLPDAVQSASTDRDPGEVPEQLPADSLLDERTFEFVASGSTWCVSVQMQALSPADDFYRISQSRFEQGERLVTVRLNVAHPFVEQWVGGSTAKFEPVLRMVVGLAVAESIAADGEGLAKTMRRKFNLLMADGLERE